MIADRKDAYIQVHEIYDPMWLRFKDIESVAHAAIMGRISTADAMRECAVKAHEALRMMDQIVSERAQAKSATQKELF